MYQKIVHILYISICYVNLYISIMSSEWQKPIMQPQRTRWQLCSSSLRVLLTCGTFMRLVWLDKRGLYRRSWRVSDNHMTRVIRFGVLLCVFVLYVLNEYQTSTTPSCNGNRHLYLSNSIQWPIDVSLKNDFWDEVTARKMFRTSTTPGFNENCLLQISVSL